MRLFIVLFLLFTASGRCRADAHLPVGFLNEKNCLGDMAKQNDGRSLDLYLFILKEAVGMDRFNLDYGEAAKSLGVWSKESTAHLGLINKALDTLEKKYKLVAVSIWYEESAAIEVKIPSSKPAWLGTLRIPSAYWDYGWNRRLTLPGKVMYLLSLHHSAASPERPRWQMAVETIARKHHVSPLFVKQGILELNSAGLLLVEGDAYTPKPLYDPKPFDKKVIK